MRKNPIRARDCSESDRTISGIALAIDGLRRRTGTSPAFVTYPLMNMPDKYFGAGNA
jgi:hypothetical protein